MLVELTNVGAMPHLWGRYPDKFVLVETEQAPELVELIKAAIRPYLPQ
ncbi:hypothetical protein ACFL6U_31195 [Planctomycetota bacterium]